MSQRIESPACRRAEIVAALSLITDLGLGQPMEHALRSAIIAVRLGETLGLNENDLSDAYYVALLRFVGCTAAAHEMSEVFGDEIAARSWLTPVFTGRLDEMPEAVLRNVGVGESPALREQRIAHVLAGLPGLHGTGAAQCEVAQLLADQLGLNSSVRHALGQVFERWDGFGVPLGTKGDQLAISVQVAQLAQNAEMAFRAGGIESVLRMARSRADSAHDPAIVERFCADASRLLVDFHDGGIWERAMAAEPGPTVVLAGKQLDQAASAFADFADLKSTYTIGHSRGVARLAAEAAQQCGLPESDVTLVKRAGLVHDIGRAGVPVGVWSKPGPLSPGEWERVRLHPYYAERALARSGSFARLGSLASLHHERLDGSGYYRGLSSAQLPQLARILTAADVYHACTEPRPHRSAHSPDQAAEELRREVRAGRIDGDAANAVLAAAGHRVRRVRHERIAGLSARETEVLRLVARGLSDRQMADRLTVSERTVHHHVEHIYQKAGVSTRAAATLFAMQHDLLGDSLDNES